MPRKLREKGGKEDRNCEGRAVLRDVEEWENSQIQKELHRDY